ncbi:hypothetical protein ANN_09237 [Periplaneta americana]|uniref:Orange domain-containing protein n=1 Tax=Periplaneta americana TaxID=6978 RepID=A0ABQ8TLQ7_PERAM|nr:hypothetical protein ANN_09237 [Periplaneta americana]
MSPGSSTESYAAFARIGLRENPGKPQRGNLPRLGFEPGPPGFAARRADRYSTDMAERLTNLLGHGEPLVTMATSEDEDDDEVGNDEDTDEANGRCVSNLDDEWISGADNSLLLAGYSDCMTEALRYLVEEERYSPEHPVVEGLRTHLAQQQDRVLLEAARAHHHHHHHHAAHLDNSRPADNSNNNNNNNQVVEVRNRVAFMDTLASQSDRMVQLEGITDAVVDRLVINPSDDSSDESDWKE